MSDYISDNVRMIAFLELAKKRLIPYDLGYGEGGCCPHRGGHEDLLVCCGEITPEGEVELTRLKNEQQKGEIMKTDRQMKSRIEVTDDAIEGALSQLRVQLRTALLKHGNLSFISTHEVVGTIREELHECELACHQNDLIEFSNEVLDIAVVCVFAHASRLQFNREE